MKLAVGFITYNEASAKYLADFLPSLEAALFFLSADNYQVYAFDNSQTGHADNRLALEAFNHGLSSAGPVRRPIKYVTQGQNLGFGRAYNILIREAVKDQAEYFLIINPDTLIEPAGISELAKALDNDKTLGSVAPKILRWDFIHRSKTDFIDSLGLVLKPGLKFIDSHQGEVDKGQDAGSEKIIGPSGAAGLFQLSALERIALDSGQSSERQYFDERFFMYKEDCDLAYRLVLAGYKSALVASAIIYHDRTAASSGRGIWSAIQDRRHKSQQVRSWSFRNQHIIFVKYWKEQNIVNKLLVLSRCLGFFIFSLILEQFLLKEYHQILKSAQTLTNTK